MEKEALIQCVSTGLMERLRKLLDRLWQDNNPAAVHLGAILDEFEPDIRSLNGVVKEYETDFAGRLKDIEEAYREKSRVMEKDLSDYKARMSALAGARDENAERAVKLEEALRAKDAEIAALKARAVEEETRLNFKFVSKMQELYDAVSRKEMEMFAAWEEKNKRTEERNARLEAECAGRLRDLQIREKSVEAEIRTRKEELLKTFENARQELEAREKDLAVREEKFAALEKKRRTVTEEI